MSNDLQRELSERQLISEVCAGKTELFYILIKPYQRTVFSVAQSILSNPADAEEVAQEVFLKAFKSLSEFRAEAKFRTWLIQIAMNEARIRLRRTRPHIFKSYDESSGSEAASYMPRDLADWREIPSEALARKELRQTIERVLSLLGPIYREVLVLRDLEHISTAETAQMLGISEDLVKTRLRRARLQMREALKPGYDGSWTVGSMEYKNVRPW